MRKKALLSGFIACVTGLLYWYIALNSPESFLLGAGNLGNIKCYILFLFITCSMFLVSYLLLQPVNIQLFISDNWKQPIFYCIVVLMLLLLYPVISKVTYFPLYITLAAQVALLLIIYLLIRVSGDSNGNVIPKILILVCGLLAGLTVATPNTFAATMYGAGFNVHHTSAYIDSIYNVMRGIEFKGDITCQYGHYALFFFIPLKIFGCSTKNIAIIMGIIGTATYILGLSSFCMIVKNKVIQIFTIVGSAFYVIYAVGNIYWQTTPHRTFFPAITLFLIACFSTHKLTTGKFIISIITMTAAMIWNTESGIVCCAAVGVWWFIRYLQECTFSYKKLGFSIIIMLSIPLIAMIFAIGVVDFYNIMCGSRTGLGISAFLGKVVDSNYVNFLETLLEWKNDIYMHKMFVFLICLCWGTANSVLNKNFDLKKFIKARMSVRIWVGNTSQLSENSVSMDHDNDLQCETPCSWADAKANYAVVLAILGLGLFTYYINRTAAGHQVVHYHFMFGLGLIISGGADIIKKRIPIKRLRIYDVTKIILAIYGIIMINNAILSSANIYNRLYARYNSLAYDYDNFTDFCEEIAEIVPQDTWGFGQGTSAVYMQLGWDKKTDTFSKPDIQEMNDQSEIFVYDGYYDDDGNFIPSDYYDDVHNNFYLVKGFEYSNCNYGYFLNKTNYVPPMPEGEF